MFFSFYSSGNGSKVAPVSTRFVRRQHSIPFLNLTYRGSTQLTFSCSTLTCEIRFTIRCTSDLSSKHFAVLLRILICSTIVCFFFSYSVLEEWKPIRLYTHTATTSVHIAMSPIASKKATLVSIQFSKAPFMVFIVGDVWFNEGWGLGVSA